MGAGGGVTMGLVLAQMASTGVGGYALDMLRALLALAAVCLLAYVVLRLLARRGLGGGFGGAARRAIEVVERVPLEPRRSLYLVRVQGRLLLIGSGESGPPGLIAELDAVPDGDAVAANALATRAEVEPDAEASVAAIAEPGPSDG